MKLQFISILAFFTVCSLYAFKCGKPNNQCKDAICTQEIRSFNMSFVDNNNNAVSPFEVEVKNATLGQTIKTFSQQNNSSIAYFSDGDGWTIPISDSLNHTLEVLVKNSNATVLKTILIKVGRDCCHITGEPGAQNMKVTL
jgi:hypothetical protein